MKDQSIFRDSYNHDRKYAWYDLGLGTTQLLNYKFVLVISYDERAPHVVTRKEAVAIKPDEETNQN